MARKVVLKVAISNEKVKTKALKAVHSLSGLESCSVDMSNQKLTITGDVDSTSVVAKLREVCFAEVISVGPVEAEAEAKEKEIEEKTHEEQIDELLKLYKQYYPYSSQPYYYVPEQQQQPPYYMPQPYGPVYGMPVEQMRQPYPYPYPYYGNPSSSSSQLSYNFSGNISWQRSYW